MHTQITIFKYLINFALNNCTIFKSDNVIGE